MIARIAPFTVKRGGKADDVSTPTTDPLPLARTIAKVRKLYSLSPNSVVVVELLSDD